MTATMTKTMLTVFVLTVVLTACDVLCEEKHCDLDLAQKLCMENFNLKEAGGNWDLMSGYKVFPTFQNFSRLSYDFIDNAPSTPADTAQIRRTLVMKDGTCRIEALNYKRDCPGRLSTEVVTIPDGTTKQVALNILVTDYEIMVFIIQRSVNNHPWTNIGVLVRDSGATLDWSAVDNVLTKICGPRPDDGNWVKFFNKFDFDLDATCKD